MDRASTGADPPRGKKSGLWGWLARRWPLSRVSQPLRRALYRRDVAVRRGLSALRRELADFQQVTAGALRSLRQDTTAARNELAGRVAEARQGIEASQQQLLELAQDYQGFRSDAARCDAAVRQELDSARSQVNALREEAASLRAAAENAAAARRQEMVSYRVELQTAAASREATLRQELETERNRTIALAQDVQALRAEVQNANATLRQELEMARNEVRLLVEDAHTLRGEVQNANTALRQELEAARSQVGLLTQDVQALRGEVGNANAALRQELEAFRKELELGRQEVEAVRAEVGNADAALRQETDSLGLNLANGLGTVRQELGVWTQSVEVLKRMAGSICRHVAQQRKALLDMGLGGGRLAAEGAERRPPQARPFGEYLAELEKAHPRTFRLWRELMEASCQAYRQSLADHCSVEGHEVASWFSCFMLPYLRGRVLDIGCGPQPVPSYLRDYPLELISAVDPIAPFQPHPFEFVHGVAEFLPWDDETFDVVLAATSLDHVLSLDLTFQEILRVIKPGGVFLVWQSHVRGAKPYDPDAPDLQPIDPYHLFHFSEEWFEEVTRGRFAMQEKLCFDGLSYFYCLRPKK